MLQITPWSIPSLAALVLAALAFVRTRRSTHMPAGPALLLICLCSCVWSFGQLIGSLTTDIGLKLLATRISWTGIALLPATWLMFAIDYLRSQRKMPLLHVALLFTLPVATVLLAWTNDLHGLLWGEAILHPVPGYVGITFRNGDWFAVSLIYSYTMVITASIVLWFELAGSPHYARGHAAVVNAPIPVALLNLLYVSPWNPWPFIDPSPLGLAISIWILNRAVLHTGLLDLSPQLHRRVVEELRDPIVIVDARGNILEANPAAQRRLANNQPLVGQPVARVLPLDELSDLLAGRARSAELLLGSRSWHVRATLLDASEHANRHLVLVLRNITERLAAENELRRMKQEMEQLAHTDPLTGLANRRFFMRRLNEEVDRATRYDHPLSVLLLDLDLFKQVNDTHGHDAGDRILVAIANTIARVKRTSDAAARFGGEEFAILLPETGGEGALRLAERIREGIAATHIEDAAGARISVTVSIGVATLRQREADRDDILVRADRALYRAKHAGRDRVDAAPD